MTFNGINIQTEARGPWQVCVLLDDGRVASLPDSRFPSEAVATLAAIAYHNAKPFMNYVARRA